MTNATHVVNIRSEIKMGNTELIDTMLCDGLIDAFDNIHMGMTGKTRKHYIALYILIMLYI